MAARSRPKKSKSVKKRARQALKRQLINKMTVSRLRTLARKVQESIAANKKEEAQKQLIEAESAFFKAASKGIIHRNTSSRKISRMALKVAKLA
ncbi:MAG: 30S ribosomal protein S20 [Nitrospirae bacterium]|nr:30S ribosomal protein S20 [Nitrospirota bacterium]MBF0535356.1 30S ribosomal protein S20 [Nitrospirota bacterium]MBF0616876.1 30S ribosomal protein S20 [Nitrospirota bacterium]